MRSLNVAFVKARFVLKCVLDPALAASYLRGTFKEIDIQ